MKRHHLPTIAATTIATIVVSILLTACEGRRMSNMQPSGDTVEVVIDHPDTIPTL